MLFVGSGVVEAAGLWRNEFGFQPATNDGEKPWTQLWGSMIEGTKGASTGKQLLGNDCDIFTYLNDCPVD